MAATGEVGPKEKVENSGYCPLRELPTCDSLQYCWVNGDFSSFAQSSYLLFVLLGHGEK